ncbi:MAG: hypothetical protein IJU01_04880 [Lachnospiraceae bacterium]|nr:hypothetical protein [Lachnospiraceae bacterium]
MEEKKIQKNHTKGQRILAWIGIGLLLALYLTNLVLALIGSDFARTLLWISLVATIMIPIILYFFILMLKKKYPENEDIRVPGEKR